MGRLIDGEWTSHDLGPDAQGRFVRRAARFRGRLGEGDLPAEPRRYRLYVSAACGWSHRTMLLRALSGLEDETKAHYYTSHESIHPRRYVPIGPDLDFDAPHGRGA